MFACGWSDSQGPEPAGDRAEAWRYRSRLNGHKACTIITNRVSGPPVGEASARSFLVPRNGTAEFVFDAPSEARG